MVCSNHVLAPRELVESRDSSSSEPGPLLIMLSRGAEGRCYCSLGLGPVGYATGQRSLAMFVPPASRWWILLCYRSLSRCVWGIPVIRCSWHDLSYVSFSCVHTSKRKLVDLSPFVTFYHMICVESVWGLPTPTGSSTHAQLRVVVNDVPSC